MSNDCICLNSLLTDFGQYDIFDLQLFDQQQNNLQQPRGLAKTYNSVVPVDKQLLKTYDSAEDVRNICQLYKLMIGQDEIKRIQQDWRLRNKGGLVDHVKNGQLLDQQGETSAASGHGCLPGSNPGPSAATGKTPRKSPSDDVPDLPYYQAAKEPVPEWKPWEASHPYIAKTDGYNLFTLNKLWGSGLTGKRLVERFFGGCNSPVSDAVMEDLVKKAFPERLKKI